MMFACVKSLIIDSTQHFSPENTVPMSKIALSLENAVLRSDTAFSLVNAVLRPDTASSYENAVLRSDTAFSREIAVMRSSLHFSTKMLCRGPTQRFCTTQHSYCNISCTKRAEGQPWEGGGGLKKTASARIHVERFIGYMKNFGILAKRVPNQLLPYLTDILFVCCHLTNLLPVIIRELDDQFKSF